MAELLTSSEVELMETLRMRSPFLVVYRPSLLTSSEVELMETSVFVLLRGFGILLLTSSEVELMETRDTGLLGGYAPLF